MCAISSTARMNAASFAFDGVADPLTLRTYWSAAARTSSSVAGGSKLWSVLMFRHMPSSLPARPTAWGHAVESPRGLARRVPRGPPPPSERCRSGQRGRERAARRADRRNPHLALARAPARRRRGRAPGGAPRASRARRGRSPCRSSRPIRSALAEHFARGVPPIGMWQGIAVRDGKSRGAAARRRARLARVPRGRRGRSRNAHLLRRRGRARRDRRGRAAPRATRRQLPVTRHERACNSVLQGRPGAAVRRSPAASARRLRAHDVARAQARACPCRGSPRR